MNATHFRPGTMWTLVPSYWLGDFQVNRIPWPYRLGNLRKITMETMEPSDMIKEPATALLGVQYVAIFECL